MAAHNRESHAIPSKARATDRTGFIIMLPDVKEALLSPTMTYDPSVYAFSSCWVGTALQPCPGWLLWLGCEMSLIGPKVRTFGPQMMVVLSCGTFRLEEVFPGLSLYLLYPSPKCKHTNFCCLAYHERPYPFKLW